MLENFASLDDYDILQSLKVWSNHTDATLKFLSSSIVNRKLFKIEIAKEPFSDKSITSVKNKLLSTGAFSEMDLSFWFSQINWSTKRITKNFKTSICL